MIPTQFPQANKVFGAPKDLHEEQVRAIPAYLGTVEGGSVDGCPIVVTAWQPTLQEIADIVAGQPVFLSVIGGLPPHFLTTRFEQATKPA